MKKESQHTKIIKLLTERKENGIGSYERIKLSMLQMPTRILELKRAGWNIVSIPIEHSKEVKYVLAEYLK